MQLEGKEGYFGLSRGTYAYMAPEQFDGMFTKEGDQYSLGCIAYELLTGRHPFECFFPFNPYDRRIMKERHKNAKARTLRELNSAIPYHTEQAILQSMAKKSSERHINIAAFIRSLQPPTGLLSQSAYHFTPPLETPQPFTSTSEEVVSPINPPDNPDASSIGVEVYEIIQPKLSFIKALQNPRHWKPPGQTLPKNVLDEENAHDAERLGKEPKNAKTDDPILAHLVSVSEKSRSNPLETLDLQLPEELKELLTPSLRDSKLTICQGRVWDEAIGKYWKYTGIAFDEPGSPVTKNNPVPILQYALIYIPAKSFNENAIFRIFSPFPHWTLIIFSDKRDPPLQLERRLEQLGKTWQITWELLRKKHIDDLKRRKKYIDDLKSEKELDESEKELLDESEKGLTQLIRGYLKLKELLRPFEESPMSLSVEDSEEERNSLIEQLKQWKSNRRQWAEQAARHGVDVPVSLKNNLEEAKKQIDLLEKQIANLPHSNKSNA